MAALSYAEGLPPLRKLQAQLSDTYEMYMTAWFSHPYIRLISNWGFWWVGAYAWTTLHCPAPSVLDAKQLAARVLAVCG